MLRVTTIHASSAGDSARYYTRYLADDGPEGAGVWLGREAAGLGLTGAVSTEDLEALLSGHDPVSGIRLGAALVDRVDAKGRLIRAVAGFDATFSAPKSLSVWWGFTGDPGLLEAHDIAVRAVLDHLEHYGATTRVRVNGARQHPDTDGLVMAAFRQATSREDDPQLHSHVVVSAKVRTADGRWWALDARYLKRKQRALGGLYQSVLRAELTHRYGIAWGPVVNGQAEIAGMPAELLEAFSKRTRQVDALLGERSAAFRDREGRDPTRWERAALTRQAAEDSRDAKTHTSTTALSSRWAEEAASLGWTPEALLASMRAAAREAPRAQPTIGVAEVVERLSVGGSTWTRADVVAAICDLAPPVSQLSGPDWVRALERATDHVIGSCTSLDPPATGQRRRSDGRSIWLPPSEPHLTHENVLAQEERILTFALQAACEPEAPSATVARDGLDVLQAEVAAAVAGHDPLVLVVGPAGTGKTTALRSAVEDLRRQGRAVFGIAPTAKAAKVLRAEAAMPADTVAKLLYEWRTGQPRDAYRLPPGSTLVLDEAGMCGTGALDQLVALAVSERWRLVLVGDSRQLQAVGRGGMLDELCRTARVHELATIHRFRHRWEQRATLQLRTGNPEALDAYLDHGRVAAGRFDDLAAEIAGRWMEHAGQGHSVAVVAETNDHVDALNAAVQRARRDAGQLGQVQVRVAGGETAAVGDHVVTRRNDRTLRTDRDEPVRNRDRWMVTAVGDDGSLTVSHLGGHGAAVLPADYARAQVRLDYAATAHGHQGDTVDVSLSVITEVTTHRGLYVGATRGREENRLYVVTDEPDQARDVLERVLTNERADVPAVAQRRNLARQVPAPQRTATLTSAEEAAAAARRAYQDALRRARPALDAAEEAKAELLAAERLSNQQRAAAERAPVWRRRAMRQPLAAAVTAVASAEERVRDARRQAEPHQHAVDDALGRLREAEHVASVQRLSERLRGLELRAPDRTCGRDVGVEPPGLGR